MPSVAAGPAPICAAPWTSLHLDPEGWATACAANRRDPLGHVTDAPLIELWRGRSGSRFRSHFADGQMAPGCEVCRWQRATSGAAGMYARIYDHLDIPERALWPSHLEFALSADCNLECEMCNGSHSSAIRRRREGLDARESPYGPDFLDQIGPVVAHAREAKFLGGEPLLAPINHAIWELMAELEEPPTCHVTTNGTILTPKVAGLLDRFPMSFAVSMDGIRAETVERIRRGARLDRILSNLDRFQAHCERWGTDLSLTYCLMRDNWHELADFLLFAERRGLGVFVNTVLSPSRFSLYLLPPHDLRAILDQLEQRSDQLEGALDRNLPVWRDQLDRLHQALDRPVSTREVPVHLPTLRRPPEIDIPEPVDAAGAEDRLARWSGGSAIAHLVVDRRGTIVSVGGADIEGVRLARLLGLGIDEVFVWLQSAFGRYDGSTYLVHAPDSGDRVLRFQRPQSTSELRLISGLEPDGSGWWRIALRQVVGNSGP